MAADYVNPYFDPIYGFTLTPKQNFVTFAKNNVINLVYFNQNTQQKTYIFLRKVK